MCVYLYVYGNDKGDESGVGAEVIKPLGSVFGGGFVRISGEEGKFFGSPSSFTPVVTETVP